MELREKLEILTDAAKYDVACTSSGVDRDAKLGHLGSTVCAGICHSFAADGRCITLLKVLMTNHCIYDCSYCINRRSNDHARAAFEPRELADLTIEFYRRNYIEGLFVSSGIIRNPDYTMERLCKTISILREEYGFNGYIHAKAIPGASQELIDMLGFLVDRMSINIELPSQNSLSVLAPDKSKQSVLEPMGLIAQGIEGSRETKALVGRSKALSKARFVPAGQSTQLIVGASPETDYHILKLSSALYRKYALKRVFFSAYLPANEDKLLPGKNVEVPLDREHRLYQADWLMRFYGFDASELIDEAHPNLDPLLDPKANWALNHLELFPIEINTAPYETLLRIPGLGPTGAKKVCRARRGASLRPESMKRLGLSLKRMRYFVTFNGHYDSPLAFEYAAIRSKLASQSRRTRTACRGGGKRPLEGQLSLLDLQNKEQTALPALDKPAQSSLHPALLAAFTAQKQKLASINVGLAGYQEAALLRQSPQSSCTPPSYTSQLKNDDGLSSNHIGSLDPARLGKSASCKQPCIEDCVFGQVN